MEKLKMKYKYLKHKFIAILFSFGFCATMFAQSLPNDSIKPYVNFLEHTTFLTPKEYILKSFEEKDIVVLSERLHPEFKQYEMIVEVIKDKHFTGNIYTEVGCFNVRDKIKDFLLKEKLAEAEIKEHILDIAKNIDYTPLWAAYNYYYLLENIYQINQQRKPDEKIMLRPLDVIFSWDSITCSEQFNMFYDMLFPQNGFPSVVDRDLIMGVHFVIQYSDDKRINPNKQKALVILNSYHGYTRIPKYLPLPTSPMIYSPAEYIYKTFPNTTKGILINGIFNSGGLVANGKWDAAFKFTGNKKVGFDLKNTPFGKTKFDMYNFGGNTYESVNFDFIFDGFVFYEPIENFEIINGIEGIFDDEVFVREYYRRGLMCRGVTTEEIESYIKELNVKTVNKKSGLEEYNTVINKWLENNIKK
jgi:hypothetical protein